MKLPIVLAIRTYGVEKVAQWVAIYSYFRLLNKYGPEHGQEVNTQFIREELDYLYNLLEIIPDTRSDFIEVSGILLHLRAYECPEYNYKGVIAQKSKFDMRYISGPRAFIDYLYKSLCINEAGQIIANKFRAFVVHYFYFYCNNVVSGCEFDIEKQQLAKDFMKELTLHFHRIIFFSKPTAEAQDAEKYFCDKLREGMSQELLENYDISEDIYLSLAREENPMALFYLAKLLSSGKLSPLIRDSISYIQKSAELKFTPSINLSKLIKLFQNGVFDLNYLSNVLVSSLMSKDSNVNAILSILFFTALNKEIKNLSDDKLGYSIIFQFLQDINTEELNGYLNNILDEDLWPNSLGSQLIVSSGHPLYVKLKMFVDSLKINNFCDYQIGWLLYTIVATIFGVENLPEIKLMNLKCQTI